MIQESSLCFLLHVDQIQKEYPEMIPVISSHDYMRMWFLKQKALADKAVKDCVVVEDVKEGTEDELTMLVTMIYSQMKEVKFCKRWLRDNLKALPNHLWEHLVLKQSKRQKFSELFSQADDDMKAVNIIDSDFELIQFLKIE